MIILKISHAVLIFFIISTPAIAGDSTGVRSTPPAGIYGNNQTVTLSSQNQETSIYYTLDGSEPSRGATKYRRPIIITSTTVVRAREYYNGSGPEIFTATYLIGRSYSLPVVSIATDPDNFFGYEKGIYVKGCCADSVQPYYGANFWKGRERRINFEYFDLNGDVKLNQNAGARIFGGFSKGLPMKSLAIFARKKYGKKHFKYPIFSEKKEIEKYKSFILRNSGGDFNKTHFRDALITQLTKPTKLPIQAYQPVIVYINGKYWGIHNAREKLNESYFKFNYGANPDSLDIMKHRNDVQEGTRTNYKALLQYLKKTNLAENSNVQQLDKLMNIDNYLDHHIIQVYADNGDAGGNIRYWRPQTEEGRWNWILFDTDLSMGIGSRKAFKVNTLREMTRLSDEKWPNPSWSTFIIRKLLENDSIKTEYVSRFSNYLNTIYSEATTLKTIDSIYELIVEEMPTHRKRWGGSLATWEKNVQRLRDFSLNRPKYMRKHLQDVFLLGDTVKIEIAPPGEGVKSLKFNKMKIEKYFRGTYFKNFPVKAEIKIEPGYKFLGWAGLDDTIKTTTILPQEDLKIEPIVVKRDTSVYWGNIIFSEVKYFDNTSPKEKDWIELKNVGQESVDFSGWKLKINNLKAVPIADMRLNPGEYIVLSARKDSLLRARPELDARRIINVKNLRIKKEGFNLMLIDESKRVVDSLRIRNIQSGFKAIYLKSPCENTHNADSWKKANETTPNGLNLAEKKEIEEADKKKSLVYLACIALLALGLILLIVYRLRKKSRKVS